MTNRASVNECFVTFAWTHVTDPVEMLENKRVIIMVQFVSTNQADQWNDSHVNWC